MPFQLLFPLWSAFGLAQRNIEKKCTALFEACATGNSDEVGCQLASFADDDGNLRFNDIDLAVNNRLALLVPAVARSTSITELILFQVRYRGSDLAALIDALAPERSNLISISVNFTPAPFGADEYRAVIAALGRNTTLQTFDIGYNYHDDGQFGDDAACALADALECNSTLKQLSLSSNEIGARGLHALARAMEKNTTLLRIELDDEDSDDSDCDSDSDFSHDLDESESEVENERAEWADCVSASRAAIFAACRRNLERSM